MSDRELTVYLAASVGRHRGQQGRARANLFSTRLNPFLVLVPNPPPRGPVGLLTRKRRSHLSFDSLALTEHENMRDVDHLEACKESLLWPSLGAAEAACKCKSQ